MTPEEIYQIWAPADALWSRWAKPVLFTQMGEGKAKNTVLNQPTVPEQVTLEPDEELASWVSQYRGNTAIIVNLPETESVIMGLKLAALGFRPVPLYNCTSGYDPIVNVDPIIRELARGAALLQTMHLSPEAPPAFLLDSARNPGLIGLVEGRLDNRWLIFPQDFPSANFLKAHGITRATLLQAARLNTGLSPRVDSDLYTVLQHWQTGDIELETRNMAAQTAGGAVLGTGAPAVPLRFNRLSRIRFSMIGMGMTMIALAGRRNSTGGFGKIIPINTSTGG